jgi:ubiquitin fusion degradation protein 1
MKTMATKYILTTLLCIFYGKISLGNMLTKAFSMAVKQTLFEQEVEDLNSLHKFDDHLVRRLIVMPLSDAFNPNRASAMFGKIQYGDKCSLPTSLGRIIFEKPYEVPWIFEVKKVPGDKSSQILPLSPESKNETVDYPYNITLDKAYISPLDFRAPENYIFMPRWLIKSLALKTNDLVDVSFVRIKLAGLVVMQPLTLAWDKLIEKNKNPQSVLEHEVNKYSSLTAGSTIAIEVDGVEYAFHVKDTKAEGGVSVKGVRVQDSDVKVDFDRSYLDDLIEAEKEKSSKKKT